MIPDDDRVLDSILRGAEEMDAVNRTKKGPTWHRNVAKFLVAVILFIPRLIVEVFKLLFSLFSRSERHTWE
jgi:hypothetical protein